jgi:hypothetical protein
MHTAFVLAGGFALLAVCGVVGQRIGGNPGTSTGALVFVPLWLVASALNLYVGVKRAGYALADELPMFELVFAIPASTALVAWWKIV